MQRTTGNTILLVLFTLAIVAPVFFLLDFKIAGSQTNVEKQSEKYAFSVESGQALPQRPDARIYVAGSGRLTRELREALLDALVGLPEFSEVSVLEEPVDRSPEALVQVEIDRQMWIWSPFYATARLDVEVWFASDGDLTWIDEDVVQMQNPEPAVRLHSQLDVRDRTAGVISRPAYNRFLAEAIAEHIRSELTGAVNRPAGP